MVTSVMSSSGPAMMVAGGRSEPKSAVADKPQPAVFGDSAAVGQTQEAKAVQESANAQSDKKPTSAKEVGDAVDAINNMFKDVHRDLLFEVDKSTHELFIKVMGRVSGEVVRQIPSDDVLKLRKQLSEFTERLDKAGLLLKGQA